MYYSRISNAKIDHTAGCGRRIKSVELNGSRLETGEAITADMLRRDFANRLTVRME